MKKLLFTALAGWLFAAPVYAYGADEASTVCPTGLHTIGEVNGAYKAEDFIFALSADKVAGFIAAFSAAAHLPLIDANTVEFNTDVQRQEVHIMFFKDGCTLAENGSFVVNPSFLIPITHAAGIGYADLHRIALGSV